MENPATWGDAERVVNEAIRKHRELLADHFCGLSQVRMITDALRRAGLLKDEGCRHEYIDCDHAWEYMWHDSGGWYRCKDCRLTVSDHETFSKIKDSIELPLLHQKPVVPWRRCQKCQHREEIREG